MNYTLSIQKYYFTTTSHLKHIKACVPCSIFKKKKNNLTTISNLKKKKKILPFTIKKKKKKKKKKKDFLLSKIVETKSINEIYGVFLSN